MAGKTKAPRVFVPLTKVDEAQRLVYGRITQELLDKSNEVMDYASSKPYFEKWSNDISEASGGLSKGNVRVMHGLTAAGKLTELDFNDDDQAIDVCAKIVDDGEWNKVVEGVYTGFSVGGSYAKRWTDTVDGQQIKKFTANPNEVSIVDNPCVPSATFAMFKADGAEVAVEFKVQNDDETWPGFKKADEVEEPTSKAVEEPEQLEIPFPTNGEVAEEATKMAKAANDGSTWMDHIEAARDSLVKAGKKTGEDKTTTKKNPPDDNEEDGKDNDGSFNDDDGKAAAGKAAGAVTPPGVKQVWTTTDGKTFEKKAEAVTHEATLAKAEPTEAEKLAARLKKALEPSTGDEEVHYLEDWDRVGHVIQALQQPFEKGAPVLEKGMYTVSSFARTLWDLGSLTKRIAAEGAQEGGDASDSNVSAEMKKAIATLSDSFKEYVSNQVDELLAGMDDDDVVCVYDYYYAAAQAKGDDVMAKDVCSAITEFKDSSRERREVLAKAWGVVEVDVTIPDEMSPTLAKRFKALEEENTSFKKIAEEAVEQIETLTKRIETVENTARPRAPRHVALRDGDTFMGKAVTTDQDRMTVLQEMLQLHGADGLATMMIKASHNSGGQKLGLPNR